MQTRTLPKIEEPIELSIGTQQLNVYQDALAHIIDNGLVLPNPPQSGAKGEMPQTITSLDDEQLGDLLNDLDQWCGFVEAELAKAEIDREAAKANLDFVTARVRLSIGRTGPDGKKLTNPDKDDLVITNSKVVEATSRHLYAEAVYRLTRVLRDKSQRSWDTVSRRITQRGQAIERGVRGHNAGNAPSQSRTFQRPRQ